MSLKCSSISIRSLDIFILALLKLQKIIIYSSSRINVHLMFPSIPKCFSGKKLNKCNPLDF